ncbi:hypothetical protein IL992_04270 [Microbispora sp. NEAU-D428]|uniref:hypothetical protein n=1 Tax=Microbispora sitophila TaxID=2771537 RepID=UPI0018663E20|nr:hypothetical protein [Microbispora sitophila]MBE3008401.1 hypothetical protein [Microbispora sitophila]
MVEDDLVYEGCPVAVGVGQPGDFLDLAGGGWGAVVFGGVAGHPHGDAVGVAVGLGVEGAQVRGGGGQDRDGEFLGDLAGRVSRS